MSEAFDRFENEDLESRSIEDAEHWLSVYSELVSGLRRMRAYEDVQVGARLRRFEARLRYWDQRLSELKEQGGR